MVGQEVKDARKAKGLSQKILAKQVGISQAALSDIEKNKFEPRDVILIALVKALGSNLGRPELDEHINPAEALPNKTDLVKDMSVREFVSLKFGNRSVRRSPKELEALITLLDAKVREMEEEDR